MTSQAKRVLIVGGGVAGPVLAIFLQRAGFLPQIFEAEDGPSAAGGALGLASNGMNVLAEAGVSDSVRDVSVTAGNWVFENQSGKTLASSSSGDPARYGQAGVMITRSALHAVLMAHAAAAGVPVRYNKCFAGIDDVPGEPVVAHFTDGDRVTGDLVVGADGIRSKVRHAILPDAPKPVYTGMMAPGGFSPCLDPDVRARSNQDVHFVFGEKGFFGYFNTVTAGGPRTVWWSTAAAPLASKEEMSAKTQADLRRQLLELHGSWAHPVPRLIESATEMLNVAIHDVPTLPRWSAGRAILIGDAAHAVAPHSGQGASMALEDAQFLAKLLCNAEGRALDQVLARFEQERRPRTDKVIALGRRNGQRKKVMSPTAYWIQQQIGSSNRWSACSYLFREQKTGIGCLRTK